jgi:ankyrin repeat protein
MQSLLGILIALDPNTPVDQTQDNLTKLLGKVVENDDIWSKENAKNLFQSIMPEGLVSNRQSRLDCILFKLINSKAPTEDILIVLEAGADINSEDDGLPTLGKGTESIENSFLAALEVAAVRKNIRAVSLILNRYEELGISTQGILASLEALLEDAAIYDDPSIMAFILDIYALMATKESVVATLFDTLKTAATENSTKVAVLLLDKYDQMPLGGSTVSEFLNLLYTAVINKSIGFAELLMKRHKKFNIPEEKIIPAFDTLLRLMAEHDDPKPVTWLLDKYQQLSGALKESVFLAALDAAVIYNCRSVVELLLARSEELEVSEQKISSLLETLLKTAAVTGRIEVIVPLWDRHQQLAGPTNEMTSLLTNLLYAAIINGDLDIIEFILTNYQKFNIPEEALATALTIKTTHAQIESAILLAMKVGELDDTKQSEILTKASELTNDQLTCDDIIIKLLVLGYIREDVATEIATEALKYNSRLAHELNQRGYITTQIKREVLLWVATQGNVEAIDTLYLVGVDFFTKLQNGRTAIMVAAENGKYQVIESILGKLDETSREQLINQQDSYGHTALDWALAGERKQAVQILIEQGADVSKYVASMLSPINSILSYLSGVQTYTVINKIGAHIPITPSPTQPLPTLTPLDTIATRCRKERHATGSTPIITESSQGIISMEAAHITNASSQPKLPPPGTLVPLRPSPLASLVEMPDGTSFTAYNVTPELGSEKTGTTNKAKQYLVAKSQDPDHQPERYS